MTDTADFVCPICNLVLREPSVVGCCEATFCQSCIQKWKLNKGECPSCGSEAFTVVPDENLKRELLKSSVRCREHAYGCKWIGKLQNYEEHLNSNPPRDTFFKGCEYVEIKCPYCSELKKRLFRKDVLVHCAKMHTSAYLTFTMKEYEKKFEAKCDHLERKIKDVGMSQSTDIVKRQKDMQECAERVEDGLKELKMYEESREREKFKEIEQLKEEMERIESQSNKHRQQREEREQLEHRKLNDLQQRNDNIVGLLKQLKQQVEKLEHKMRVQLQENEKMQSRMKDSERIQLAQLNEKLLEMKSLQGDDKKVEKLEKDLMEKVELGDKDSQDRLEKHREEVDQAMKEWMKEVEKKFSCSDEERKENRRGAEEDINKKLNELRKEMQRGLEEVGTVRQKELEQFDDRQKRLEKKMDELLLPTEKESQHNGMISELTESVTQLRSNDEVRKKGLVEHERRLKEVEKVLSGGIDKLWQEESEKRNSEIRQRAQEEKESMLNQFKEEMKPLQHCRDELGKHEKELERLKVDIQGLKEVRQEETEKYKSEIDRQAKDKMDSDRQKVIKEMDSKLNQSIEQLKELVKEAVDKHKDQQQELEKYRSEVKAVDKQLKKVKEDVDKLPEDKLKILERRMEEQDDKQKKVEKKIEVLVSPSQSTGPVVLTMHNYDHYRSCGADWFSSGFYTHGRGYKICLGISAKGYGKGEGNHISVYLHVMGGEFDAHLKWPFKGQITVQLVSQKGVKRHYAKTITFDDKKTARPTTRVAEGERNAVGCGFEKFISHHEIERSSCCIHDSLQFEITKVVIDH